MTRDVTGLILAGGQSKRFGSDKALHEIDGQPMIHRVYNVLSSIAGPIFISTGKSDRIYDLPVKRLIDVYPDAGPLAGLHAGLLAANTEWVVVLATDMPFVTADVLSQLIGQCDELCDAVVTQGKDRIQPLCGCYSTRLVGRIEKRLQNQSYSVMDFVNTVKIKTIPVVQGLLANINRLQDLAP